MSLGDWIDRGVAVVAPVAAARRIAAREGIRQFDAAAESRRTRGWRRPHTDADAENARAQARLRAGGRDLVRNNKYAEAGVRHLVADMIGDGIAPQFVHPDPIVAQKAQDHFDRWAEARVDGHDDFYGYQKTGAWGTVVDGEVLTLWKPDATGPDGRIQGLESDYLDASKIEDRSDGSRIMQGVEFDANSDLVGYWLFDKHPGGMALLSSYRSAAVPAQHVDHVFERTRFGQTRGVSWLASTALDFRDVADLETAIGMQQKIAACLGLVLTPGDPGRETSTLSSTGQTVENQSGKREETLTPGMIYRAQHGDTVSTINPPHSGQAVDVIRHRLAAVSARLAPYHRITGDVSQANYSSLRAAMLGMWALLDDWQQNVFIPHMVRPAVNRRLRRAALELRDPRILDVRVNYALPIRRFVDPVKDSMAEIMEIRAGLKTLFRSLAERGINGERHLREFAEINKIIDELSLALETDPRRLTDSGVLQAAAGYLASGDKSSK